MIREKRFEFLGNWKLYISFHHGGNGDGFYRSGKFHIPYTHTTTLFIVHDVQPVIILTIYLNLPEFSAVGIAKSRE